MMTEYSDVRGEDATLKAEDMLLLDAGSSLNQPCSSFGLHKNLGVMKELYDEGMGVIFANTGRK